jgi:uncharacterized protein YdiU (UPF0061 family)
MLPSLNNSYRTLPSILFEQVEPAFVKNPRLIAFNEVLAAELGLNEVDLKADELSVCLSGNSRWPGSEPIALASAGHQFGGFSKRLGDGRAHLLGELRAMDGVAYDLQLKGSGPTPYSRGGDGRAALGPVLREYLVSEAMHAFGVPTTRALAAVATGETVYRERPLPGAVLTRVAKSHLRVGSFEFLASQSEHDALSQLVDYALLRLYPDADPEIPAPLRLLDSVIEGQAFLIAQWMGLGFIHGVMNTDNCAISGQTIDYGPCAFMDSFDPHRKFSSIDRGARYAFNQQPNIAQWNLARLAEALLPLVDKDEGEAVRKASELLHQFPRRYEQHFGEVCARKLGLGHQIEHAAALMTELMTIMHPARSDFTLTFRGVYDLCKDGEATQLTNLLGDTADALQWIEKFKRAYVREASPADERLAAMRQANPYYIPRNHRIEEVIAAAVEGDEAPFFRLHEVLKKPWDPQAQALDLAEPPGEEQWTYKTFCGT